MNEIIHKINWMIIVCCQFGILHSFEYNTQLDGVFVPIETIKSDYKEAPCVFDVEEGGRICNCGYHHESMVLPKMGGNIFQVFVMNCKRLYVNSDTFVDLSSISKISFTNVENLILESNSLRFPLRIPSNRVQLELKNTIIEVLPSHSINGNIDAINFENCKIGIIRAFAITGLLGKAFKIAFINSSINRLEPQALKKFSVDQFFIHNSDFASYIPSKAFYDFEVSEVFSILNSNFTGIHSGGFMLKEIESFRCEGNAFNELSGSAFQMQIRESIIIQNNYIRMESAAFKSITLDSNYFNRHSEPLDFKFSSNTIDIIDRPITIRFPPLFQQKLSKIYFIEPMNCLNISNLKNNNFFNVNSDSIYVKMIDSLSNSSDSSNYHSYSHVSNVKCVRESYLLYIIIGIVVLVIILIVIFVIILMIYLRKKRAQQLNIIQPEGKTYRETQIVMQIENAGLLKTDL